jgi:hypothetical protein
VFACDSEDSEEEVEYVVKFRSTVRGGRNGLCFEFFAAQVAILLGIPMPRPALIELDNELYEATRELAVRERIHRSIGLNFGTEYKTPGYTTWPVDDLVPPQLRQVASEIFAFDALIDNADRRRDKPNMLYNGDEILVIDHETAFAFTRLIGTSQDAWTVERINFLYNHPFYSDLRGQPLELERFASAVQRMTDEEIKSISAAVPSDFSSDYVGKIGRHLAAARDRVEEMIDALGRILQ